MIKDLIIAAAITLVAGVAALQSRAIWFGGSAGDSVVILCLAVAVAAGPLYLWRRGRQPIVPIAAVFCVVMLMVVFAVDFVIAARRGGLEF